MADAPDVTRMLQAMQHGDEQAASDLMDVLYRELHAMAHRQLGRFGPDETLNTTALVHEAYLKLVDAEAIGFTSRRHFLGTAARAMRHIVIDYARKRRAEKRGGGAPHIALDDAHARALRVAAEAEALLALDDALAKLAALDERLVQVIELRFFGGLSVEEAAEVLGVSTPTVKRDTRAARAFLYKAMAEGE